MDHRLSGMTTGTIVGIAGSFKIVDVVASSTGYTNEVVWTTFATAFMIVVGAAGFLLGAKMNARATA